MQGLGRDILKFFAQGLRWHFEAAPRFTSSTSDLPLAILRISISSRSPLSLLGRSWTRCARLWTWLGDPRWKQTAGRVTFVYRFQSEGPPAIPMRLKVEINSREHFAIYGFKRVPFSVSSRWFEGSCEVSTYALEELLGTKLRALYQRRKGRDLFDLATALDKEFVDPKRIVTTFSEYMKRGGHSVTRATVREKSRSEIE